MSADANESTTGVNDNSVRNMQASEYLFHTSSFRAATTTLQNDHFSEAFLRKFCATISSGSSPLSMANASTTSENRGGGSDLYSSALIPSLLSLAIVSPDCGTLAVVEQIEERWAALWDELCTIDFGAVPLSSSSSGLAVDKLADASSSRPVVKTQSSTSVSTSNANASASGSASDGAISRTQLSRASGTLESAARAGLLPFVSHAFARAPPPAELNGMIAQMTDMGLPREWCEAALRRCRYNIEMAINMCFESGIDMAQIVAEEAARSAIEPPAGLISAGSRPSNRREESGDGVGLSFLGQALLGIRPSGGLPPGLSATFGISSGSGSGGSGSAASRRAGERVESAGNRMQQLLDMGFPPHWCTLAMRATNNNVDAALGWIFAHGDELVNEPTLSGDSQSDSAAMDEETSGSGALEVAAASGQNPSAQAASDRPLFNPLSPVSGSCDIRDDLHCICNPLLGNFPSVGCRGFGASSGKWYYEVTLLTAGCIQLGWADGAYKGSAINGQGVGDCSHSWAFDGWRVHTWHEVSSDWAPDGLLVMWLDALWI